MIWWQVAAVGFACFQAGIAFSLLVVGLASANRRGGYVEIGGKS